MRAFRVLAFSLAVTSIALPAQAQKPPHRVGPIGGINFATVGGDDATDVNGTTAWFVGGFADLVVSRRFAISPEVLWTRKGAESSEPGVTLETQIDYIEIPLLAKVLFPPSGGGRWGAGVQLYAGPAIAFKTNCNSEVSSGGVTANFDCEDIPDVEVKSTDVSAVAGIAASFGDLILGLRYTYGFSKIISEGGDDLDVKNRVFAGYLGWGFRLP